MLHCASCGRRLIGDGADYYRHPDACPSFKAATPEWPKGWKGRHDGKGYPRYLYETAIAQVLEQVSIGADTLGRVVGLVTSPPSSPDRLALARIERDRDAALALYRRDRDSAALDRRMACLDAEEMEARRPVQPDGIPAEVAVGYLRDLATTWRKAEGGPGRRMLAEALFERIDALGFREATLRLTGEALAHGFASVISERLDLSVGYGRGERFSGHTFKHIMWIDSGKSPQLQLVRTA
jgi:hypothetical protein